MTEVNGQSKGKGFWEKVYDKHKHYNYAKSAFLATVLAVIFLGSSIFLLTKVKSKDVQVDNLQNQVSSLTTANYNASQNYTVNYNGQNGQTAYVLLTKNHNVVSKNYSGLGQFVTEIDGVKPSASNYWGFYVNGKPSDVGASQYKTKNGDKIEWKLTPQ